MNRGNQDSNSHSNNHNRQQGSDAHSNNQQRSQGHHNDANNGKHQNNYQNNSQNTSSGQSKENLYQNVKQKAHETMDAAKDQLKGQNNHTQDKVSDTVSQVVENLKDKGQEMMNKSMGKAVDGVSAMREQVGKVVSNDGSKSGGIVDAIGKKIKGAEDLFTDRVKSWDEKLDKSHTGDGSRPSNRSYECEENKSTWDKVKEKVSDTWKKISNSDKDDHNKPQNDGNDSHNQDHNDKNTHNQNNTAKMSGYVLNKDSYILGTRATIQVPNESIMSFSLLNSQTRLRHSSYFVSNMIRLAMGIKSKRFRMQLA